MYTGIIQGTEQVLAIDTQAGYQTIHLSNQHHFFDGASIGASIAVDGVCLTLTQLTETEACFDVSDQTALITTLGQLHQGQIVNIERSHITGTENGGHNLYGHIQGKATVVSLTPNGQTLCMRLALPDNSIQYFFDKGFIGLHGASLTVHEVDKKTGQLSVYLIPETLRLTNLKDLTVGSQVNIEVDHQTRVMVDVITALLGNR